MNEKIIFDDNGLVVYSYVEKSDEKKLTLFGFRIYETSEKLFLSYESVGFETSQDATNGMNQVLRDFFGEG